MIPDEINGMENTTATNSPLPVRTDILGHRSQVGLQVVQALGDLGQAVFDGVQPGRQRVTAAGVFGLLRWRAPVQHGVQVLRMPPEGGGQGLQRSRAPPALHRVVLDLPDDRLRDARSVREFPLAPSERVDALVYGLGD
ncbi:hypothetical protein [Saccharopolyspora sp. NFXS83]|uniref:hypothetical protein n=1 Tax=Saccharopolyspora sp. NFXS83 TaxID=2993560 RepID=UPI003A4DD266